MDVNVSGSEDVFSGCPLGAGVSHFQRQSSRRVSRSSRQPKLSVRRQSELFRDYSENRPFHDLSYPVNTGIEPYTDIELQELYGQVYISRFDNRDCGDLLKNIGLNLYDLLNALESIHVHLFVEQIPVIQIPYQMYCEKKESDETLLFHFFALPNSRFTDPQNMVAGIIRQTALFAFKMDVSVNLELEEKCGDIRHSVFAIKEVFGKGQEPVGRLFPRMTGAHYYFPRELLVSPKTLCKACPFHVIFDRDLNLVEIGSSLQRLLKIDLNEDGTVASRLNFASVFELKRPPLIELAFDMFLDRFNSVVEVKIKESAAVSITRRSRSRSSRSRSRSHTSSTEDDDYGTCRACITIRGQMIYALESDSLLFLGSPLVRTLDDVDQFGLYISDIAVHDATRDLILQNGAYQGHLTLVDQLEKMNSDIEIAQQSLKEQQEGSNKLLRSMLPNPVADALLRGEEVMPQQYESVTIMFSDLTNFADLTADWEPRQIVDLLNHMYTEFDEILPCHNVYKVETVNDSYMVVGGCPEENEHHAREVARMAVDMMDTMDVIKHPVTHNSLTGQLRIGIHSGSIRAGVVGTERPRYCLFGDTVNVTSRTLTAGISGAITITEHTHEKLKHYDEFDLLNPRDVQMKGVEKPVTCYTLMPKERSMSLCSAESTSLRRMSRQIKFEWMSYAPTVSASVLDRRYLGGRSVSCPQPAGNPNFSYLSMGHAFYKGNQSLLASFEHQHCVLPVTSAPPKSKMSKEGSGSSIKSRGSRTSSSRAATSAKSSLGIFASQKPLRASVSQSPGGLMITVSSPHGSSLTATQEEDESEEFGVNSKQVRQQQFACTDDVFLGDQIKLSQPQNITTSQAMDGTDIDAVSLLELEMLKVTLPSQRSVLESHV